MHGWAGSEHCTGAVQVPAVQVSAESQQGSVRQDWPVLEQVGPVPPWQVPLVAPGGTSQDRPEQQSAEIVQAPPVCWHGGRQNPPSQIVEQHCEPEVQAFPFGRQDAQRRSTAAVGSVSRQRPTQQGVAPPAVLHVASGSRHTGGGAVVAQAQPNSGTYLHRAPSQHSPCTGV